MNLSTKTGEGGAEVCCAFSVDIDGDVVDLEVNFDGENILKALSFEQIEALEMECFAHYMAEAEQSNTDAAIDHHLDKQGEYT
jgi:hypothetical protein